MTKIKFIAACSTRLGAYWPVRIFGIASLSLIVLLSSCAEQTADPGGPVGSGIAVDAELMQSTLDSLEESCGLRFAGLQLPAVKFAIPAPDLQSTVSDYLLFKFLGFVTDNFETYIRFADAAADERLGSYNVATETIHLHPRLRDASVDLIRVALFHELVHSWHLQMHPEITESLRSSMSAEPDRYLVALAMAEGFAVTCMDTWLKSHRSDVMGRGDGLTYIGRNSNHGGRSTFTYEASSDLSRFHRRTWQWVYGLGSNFFSDVMNQASTGAFEDLAGVSLPSSTAELIGYQNADQCNDGCRSLGALLTREMLIWSGLDWQAADAVSLSVLEDALDWTDDDEGSTCARLEVVYRELRAVHPRTLGVRDALRRWAAVHGHSILLDEVDPNGDGRSMLTFQHCYSRKTVRESAATRDRRVARYVVAAGESDIQELKQQANLEAVLVPHEAGSVVDALVQASEHPGQREEIKATLSAMVQHPEAYVESLPGEEAHLLRSDAENALGVLDSAEFSSRRPAAPSAADDPLSFTIRAEWL